MEDGLHMGLYGPGPEAAHITSPCFPLVITEPWGCSKLQGSLGNIVDVHSQEEETGWGTST